MMHLDLFVIPACLESFFSLKERSWTSQDDRKLKGFREKKVVALEPLNPGILEPFEATKS